MKFKKLIKENKKTTVTITIVMTAVIAVCSVLLFSLESFLSKSTHDERDTYLKAQTSTSAALINEVIDKYSTYSTSVGITVSDNMSNGDNIFTFMKDLETQLYLPQSEARVILIDESCTWYRYDAVNQENISGKITSLDSYESGTADQLTYITTGVDVTIESFVFRQRLKAPILSTDGINDFSICYCAVICYMDQLYEKLQPAYPFACNKFIVDETGVMLYKNVYGEDAIGSLIDGSNLFAKYEMVDFLYGDTSKGLIEEIENDQISVAEFELNGKNYFICTKKLKINNWAMSYVVEASSLSTGKQVTTISYYLSGILFTLTVAILVTVLLIIKSNNEKKKLIIEKQSNALLEEASKAKSKFLSNMSHDIRTPLNGIIGMTEIAKKQQNPAKTDDCLRNIENVSNHLLSLVNDVLDMSHIESGKVQMNVTTTNIYDILETCSSVVQGYLERRDLSYQTTFDNLEHPYVFCDPVKLKDIFINLLSNSIKYTKDGGSIFFRMKKIKEDENEINLQFEIEDTGIGMSSEFVKHAFDPFVQEKGGSRTTYKGSGLGLTITKNYIEMMNGTIALESEEDVGSKFTINLCFKKGENQKSDQEEVSIKDVKILLVDDNKINLIVANELLKAEGAIILQAQDGKSALEQFINNEQNIDVILMDIMMPEISGIEATKLIRESNTKNGKSVPIIAMTAKGLDEDVQLALESGMDAYLTKPMQINDVKNTIFRLTKERK